MKEIPLAPEPLERYRPLVSEAEFQEHLEVAAQARERWAGRTLWNVSSTAVGGGVAEMLRAILPYARGVGIDMRWMVLDGTPEFFRITKRIHHALHGSTGDGTELGSEAREVYERVLAAEMAQLEPLLRPGDLLLLHDPQTAGLLARLDRSSTRTVWRCHIGQDTRNDETARGWAFLEPYVTLAHATVFSKRSFIPDCCDHERATVIHPSIDFFSPKNQQLSDETVAGILDCAGLVRHMRHPGPPLFTRSDGSPGRVLRQARLTSVDGPPRMSDPLVVQVSRWDPLKDPVGVMQGFVWMLESVRDLPSHLVLAGPDPDSIADDPEGLETYEATVAAYEALPAKWKPRIHLAALPMADPEENAAIVNALQRHATVIVQKSLAEGFGLTVTEGMAKGRPVLASAVGGILEQIEHGVHGLLLDDPRDPARFAELLAQLLGDPAAAREMGKAGQERALREFSGLRSLRDYEALFARVDDEAGRPAAGVPSVIARLRAALGRVFRKPGGSR